MEKQLNLKVKSDWYKISTDLIVKKGAQKVLSNYGNNLIHALQAVFPEEEWIVWLFEQVPKNFWDEISNQKTCLEWMAKKLNVTSKSGWYAVTNSKVRKIGGGGILSYHHGSLPKALKTCFPEEEWIPWLFEKTPANFWNDRENQRRFFDWLAKELKIEKWEHWKRVTKEMVVERGGGGLLTHYGHSHVKALHAIYPGTVQIPFLPLRVLRVGDEEEIFGGTKDCRRSPKTYLSRYFVRLQASKAPS